MLRIVVHVKRVHHAHERHQREHVREHEAQAIDAAERQILSDEAHHAVGARLQEKAVDQRNGRHEDHGDAFGRAPEQRDEPCADNQHEARDEPTQDS